MKTHLNTFSPFANASAISIDAIHIKPSPTFKVLAIVMGITALLFGVSMPMSPAGFLALAYLGIVALIFVYTQYHAIHTVRKQHNGLFFIESRTRMWNDMQLQGSSISTPFVCILYFKADRAWFSKPVVVWADSVPTDVFRRLRGWLNWSI